MDAWPLCQPGPAGQVVDFEGTEWITLYQVPVDNENSKEYDFFIAVPVNQKLPSLCSLIMVPRTQRVAPSGTNVDKPA